MEEEAQFFYPYLEDATDLDSVCGIVRTVRGKLEGCTVDVVICGIGAVHAAMATTAALTAGPADAVLSCGCSGAHLPSQVVGDIVIGKTVVPLSAEVVERSGKSRLCGVRCSMLDQATMGFEADPILLRLGTAAAESVRDEIVCEMVSASADPPRAPRVDVSVVGSSDVWRQSPSVIEQTHELSGSACEEMEAHAVAQVCRTFGVPFLAIKDVANSEIHPEPIQLEPTDSVVPESCQVGVNACRVTARVLSLIANDGEFAAAAASRLAKRPKRAATPQSSQGEGLPVGKKVRQAEQVA